MSWVSYDKSNLVRMPAVIVRSDIVLIDCTPHDVRPTSNNLLSTAVLGMEFFCTYVRIYTKLIGQTRIYPRKIQFLQCYRHHVPGSITYNVWPGRFPGLYPLLHYDSTNFNIVKAIPSMFATLTSPSLLVIVNDMDNSANDFIITIVQLATICPASSTVRQH